MENFLIMCWEGCTVSFVRPVWQCSLCSAPHENRRSAAKHCRSVQLCPRSALPASILHCGWEAEKTHSPPLCPAPPCPALPSSPVFSSSPPPLHLSTSPHAPSPLRRILPGLRCTLLRWAAPLHCRDHRDLARRHQRLRPPILLRPSLLSSSMHRHNLPSSSSGWLGAGAVEGAPPHGAGSSGEWELELELEQEGVGWELWQTGPYYLDSCG